MKDIKEKILELIEEIDEMIRNNVDKKKIEIKRKELDKLLLIYIKDI
ncbi:MAG: Spo0E family sporulation regulatory protein-aspartic acid phosphatase [Clostridia bacterium]|nr:Spo0E family sporulation regulatory protein-aspartic acid phosphatase [Clostridia bacterium]